MRLLLDTHALVWFLTSRNELPLAIRRMIESDSTLAYVSPISAYEVALKFKTGRWPEVELLVSEFSARVLGDGFAELPINLEHARLAGLLPLAHRDPFDRILAAQSIAASLSVLSADPALDLFGVTRIWA